MNLRQAAQQALEALERINAIHYLQDLYEALDWEIDALRAALAEPEQEPVDSPEKAGAYMDARLWEFIDMAAAWPETRPDSRTWDHVMVYAPTPRKPLTDEEMRECAQAMNAEPLAEGWPELIKFARAIERAHCIGDQHE